MPLGITTYVDPGVYVREKIQPGSVTVSAERVLCLIGIAPRTVRITDEALVRGKVYTETVTIAGSAPHIGTLSSTADRDRNNAVLYRNARALPLGEWSFNAAFLQSANATVTVDTSTKELFTVSMDGIEPITIVLTNNGALPIADLVTEINAAFLAATNYGATYSAVATAPGNKLTLTSPLTTSASDVKIFLSYNAALDAAGELSLGVGAWAPTDIAGVQADSIITVAATSHTATDVFTIDYVTVDSLTDALSNADATNNLDDIVSVGSFPGAYTYTEATDFIETGNTLDWVSTVVAQAVVTTDSTAGMAAIGAGNEEFRLAMNGNDPVTVSLTNGAAVAATIAADINEFLATNAGAITAGYGPTFGAVAQVSGVTVVITAPKMFANYPVATGSSSEIILYETTNTGITNMFSTLTFPTGVVSYSYVGTGARPSFGSAFYCSYDYDRPSTDYETPTRVYNLDQLYAYTSPITSSNYALNELAIAGEIAFENGVSSLIVCQINDSNLAGTPTQNEINDAIDGAETSSVITDVAVLSYVSGSITATQTALMNHVSGMSSLIEKKYRRGWFGMPRSTSVGDPDTPDTFVYASTQTLQPGNTSPGRGRLVLCAPSNCSRTLSLGGGGEVTVELDGNYIAVADAAVFCSLGSPADAMLGKFIVGFLADSTFGTYLQAERYVLADNGVNVNTFDAGNIIMLDPLTTESGGSIQHEEPSSSAQKDAVTRSIESVLDFNVKGIVPDDLADFIVDIKLWIGAALNAQINAGSIGGYRATDGSIRQLDYSTDIQVFQDSTDPRSFTFKYWFNLKYVAKRFFGEYSVDNPFFSS